MCVCVCVRGDGSQGIHWGVAGWLRALHTSKHCLCKTAPAPPHATEAAHTSHSATDHAMAHIYHTPSHTPQREAEREEKREAARRDKEEIFEVRPPAAHHRRHPRRVMCVCV